MDQHVEGGIPVSVFLLRVGCESADSVCSSGERATDFGGGWVVSWGFLWLWLDWGEAIEWCRPDRAVKTMRTSIPGPVFAGDHSSPGHNMAGLQPSRKTAKYAAILKLISAGGFAPGACARPRADAPSGFKKRWSGGTQSRNPGKRLRGKI